MNSQIKRVFVQKRPGFDVQAKSLLEELIVNLNIKNLKDLKIINRYEVKDIGDEIFNKAKKLIFSEPNVDFIEDELLMDSDYIFGVEYLLGQYDQRADSCQQAIQILDPLQNPKVKTAKIYKLYGNLNEIEIKKIENFCINPVDSQKIDLNCIDEVPISTKIEDVEIINGFTNMGIKELEIFHKEMEFAMTFDDLKLVQNYFKEKIKDPTITELKVIDTYWSDHCRHTTFLTKIKDIKFEDGNYQNLLKDTWKKYLKARDFVYENKKIKNITLMDIATIAMKSLKKQGLLNDLEESEEINACSIKIKVKTFDNEEDWLLFFKNETHNHPTEIEPFGGAATCLGGAIRDPLSARAYVYQAMRVTGSADPTISIEDTMKGKLPQRQITKQAANGYSSYGNQIGIATGKVAEFYDPDFVAKRMEVGAVIAAAPMENVVRKSPKPGDVIILLGGKTGRDGCGGATGSSKTHDVESIIKCGAQVQKGNAPEERKIQRFFRNPEVTKKIKKCNDFGAGGVCVAIGELAPGLEIYLDNVEKKYEGLNATELAISESQERMAIVVDAKDENEIIKLAQEENLQAKKVALVTEKEDLVMYFKGEKVVDLSRKFLDTNGAQQEIDVFIENKDPKSYFKPNLNFDIKTTLISKLKDLNHASQKGLVEKFDSTIGASTVLMPLGGKNQLTPNDAMVAKIPKLEGDVFTTSVMSFGYFPKIGKISPFHGAYYSTLESLAKIASVGASIDKVRFSFQEYFGKPMKDSKKWGMVTSSLLGAFKVQDELNIPAIGGKDSMSGTFNDIDVPPTLISFAVTTQDSKFIISQELKNEKSYIALLEANQKDDFTIDLKDLKSKYNWLLKEVEKGSILSAKAITDAGFAAGICQMAFGNDVCFKLNDLTKETLFEPKIGSIILQIKEKEIAKVKNNIRICGEIIKENYVSFNEIKIELDELKKLWQEPLESIFPTKTNKKVDSFEIKNIETFTNKKSYLSIAKPKVIIPVFPGTNCEYDTARAFINAGADVEFSIFKNLNSNNIKESIDELASKIKKSQILALPGGFSAGDEPDGSGKFIATILRNPKISQEVMELINNKDGLILGICNGFQALVKVGLLPYGEIRETKENDPTLTFNNINRHISKISATKVVSNNSPWLMKADKEKIYNVPVSHGEGRFVISNKDLEILIQNGQIATQYVTLDSKIANKEPDNPNGSICSIEGITSKDGRIFGKMGHSERVYKDLYKNIPNVENQNIFLSGVSYFK